MKTKMFVVTNVPASGRNAATSYHLFYHPVPLSSILRPLWSSTRCFRGVCSSRLPATRRRHRFTNTVERSCRHSKGTLRYYGDMDHWCHTDVIHRLYPEVTAYRWHRCKSWSGTTFHDRIVARGKKLRALECMRSATTAFNVIVDYIISNRRDRPCTRA